MKPPTWYAESITAKLPDDCRAKCERCFGYGTDAGLAINLCAGCQTGPGPCPTHTCRQCDGSGLVCPQCRGMRFVRTHEWDQHSPFSDALDRCVKCTEGNNVSHKLEKQVIERYMARWRMEHDRFKNNNNSDAQLRIATEAATARETHAREGGAQ